MPCSTFIALPVKPRSRLTGQGQFSVAAGTRCPECQEDLRRFDTLTCADAVSFKIACALCGMVIFERR
jgi:hypothetical protein